MAKLVEILARELKEWPEDARILVQDGDLEAKFGDSACLGSSRLVWERVGAHSSIYLGELAEDWDDAQVTRAQWEAERARQELAAIACGKRSAEEQALWDRVYFRALEIGLEDGVKKACTRDDVELITTGSAHIADAFMSERAKRMEVK